MIERAVQSGDTGRPGDDPRSATMIERAVQSRDTGRPGDDPRGATMIERAVQFGDTGEGHGLVGVVLEPAVEPASAGRRLTVVLLNAGFVHRVGPGRLSVEIARELGRAGVRSLRFDLAGIGDSPPRPQVSDRIASGLIDIRAALDYLELSHPGERFVLLGQCSGARHAHHAAVEDPRVVGAVLLDGYAYPTLRSRLIALGYRLHLDEPSIIARALRRRVDKILGRSAGPPARRRSEGGQLGAFFPPTPPRERMARDLVGLARRGVRLLAFFTGEWEEYRYEGQLRESFPEVPLAGLLTERFVPQADHLYFTDPERQLLLASVRDWLITSFT